MNMRFTILICCYNGERFLRRALDSAFGQTLDPSSFEVVFIDDASTDSTHEIAMDYMDGPNFRYYRNEQNTGLVASCNKGLNLAKGVWVIRLDADDAFSPDMLEHVCRYADDEKNDFIYTDRKDVYWDRGEERYVDLSRFNLFELIATGIMMRKQTLLQIGGYRNLFWEEYDLYIRYFQYCKGKIVHIPQPLYHYSIYQGSMTSDPQKVNEGWQELINEWGIDILKQYGSHPRLL